MTLSYEQTMRHGAAQYADVLQALWGAGFPASFTQTGGMCAAIEVRLDGGATLLVTDADDSLAWSRDEHCGWGVGLYPSEDEYDSGCLAFDSAAENDTETLLALVEKVLRQGV